MIVKTRRFGELAIDEGMVFTFVNGLMGFEHLKKYIVVDHPGSTMLKWLQSVEDGDLALPAVDPTAFFPDYAPTVAAGDLAALKLANLEDGIVLCVVTVPADPARATVNLKAPVVFNPRLRLADQVIAENQAYLVRQPLNLKKPERCER